MPVLTVLGGDEGRKALEGILALPKQSAGGRAAYPTIFDKAAVLLRSMILNHPFVDGNKRMGVAATLDFLYLNDEIVCATDGELVRLALGLATGHGRGLDALARWFEARSVSPAAIEEAIRTGGIAKIVGCLPGKASLSQRPLLDFVVHLLSS